MGSGPCPMACPSLISWCQGVRIGEQLCLGPQPHGSSPQVAQKLNTIRWDPLDTLMPDSVRILEGQAGRGIVGEVGFPQSPDRPLMRGVEVALMGTSCGKRMPSLRSWGNQGSASFQKSCSHKPWVPAGPLLRPALCKLSLFPEGWGQVSKSDTACGVLGLLPSSRTAMEVESLSQEARVSLERELQVFWKGCKHPAAGPAPKCPQVQPLPPSDSITNHAVMVA